MAKVPDEMWNQMLKKDEVKTESDCSELLSGFDEWWIKRGYAADCPSDKHIAEDAWKAARGLQYYPCEKCGQWRTTDEGGTTFTVCEDCWYAENGNR